MIDQELISKVDLSRPLFKARSSEVFDLSEDKVLKLFFEEIDDKAAEIEYLNIRVAYDKGCTPMECYGKVRIGNRNGLVLKKLKGCSMTDLPTKNPLLIFKAGEILAGLHVHTHAQTSSELRDVRMVALEALDPNIFSFLDSQKMKKLIQYINSLPQADNIIHLDFHTDNVLCDGDNYQVIDWMTACRGSVLAELSMMNFLFSNAELFPDSPRLKIFVCQVLRSYIFKGFIKNYEKMTGTTLEDSKPWDIIAYVLRLGIWNIESEREYLQNAITQFIANIKK